MNNKEYMVSELLDRYENSRSFRIGEKPRKRISINLYGNNKNDFYDVEQSDKRIMINRDVMELSQLKLLSYEWLKGEENHIISKIWLNYDNLQQAYEYVGRQPKQYEIEQVCRRLSELRDRVNTDWIKCFVLDTCEQIQHSRTLGNRLPATAEEREALFKTFEFIDKTEDNIFSARVFSMKCFGDSKYFERNIKSRILSILKRYTDTDDNASEEELLNWIGIAKYPETIEFSGKVSLICQGGTIDFSLLRYGACISACDCAAGQLLINSGVNKILSVENKANYIDYINCKQSANEVVIYHGGQFSRAKGRFLRTIADAMPDGCEWSHWGDIDYGGFSMLARLRREILPDILPYRMSEDELKRYDRLTAGFDDDYAKKLKTIQNYPELSDVENCIKYMLTYKKKLEQEAMLTE